MAVVTGLYMFVKGHRTIHLKLGVKFTVCKLNLNNPMFFNYIAGRHLSYFTDEKTVSERKDDWFLMSQESPESLTSGTVPHPLPLSFHSEPLQCAGLQISLTAK